MSRQTENEEKRSAVGGLIVELSMGFWIGFLLNTMGGIIMLWPCFGFLTLKKERKPFEVLVYVFMCIVPVALVKFTSDAENSNYIIWDIITNLILLIWLKWAFCDSIGRCVVAHVLMLGNGLIGSSLWMLIWGDLEMHQQNPVYMYFTHMVCIMLVSPISFFILKRLRLRDWPENRLFYIWAACIIVNVLSLIDLNQKFSLERAGSSLLLGTLFVLFMAECMIVIYIIYRLCIQKEKLDRLANLSALRKHEEENCNHLCRKTERMAKLRHDFKGQLFVARHIASVDYDEGMRMIEELRAQIKNEPTDRG